MTDPANPSDNGPSSNPPAAAAVARHPGHELPFVTPSTYLHLRAPMATATPNLASAAPPSSSHSHTIPAPALAPAPEKPLMTPLDKDQVQGLVSNQSINAQIRTRISRTETLSVSSFSRSAALACAVAMTGRVTIPSASPAASPTSASLLLTCWARHTLRCVHAGAGYPWANAVDDMYYTHEGQGIRLCLSECWSRWMLSGKTCAGALSVDSIFD